MTDLTAYTLDITCIYDVPLMLLSEHRLQCRFIQSCKQSYEVMTSSMTRQDSDVNHKVGFGEDPYRDKNDDVICYDRYDMIDMNALLSTCHRCHACTWCIRKSIKRIQIKQPIQLLSFSSTMS